MPAENRRNLQLEIEVIEKIMQYIIVDFELKGEGRYRLETASEYREYFREISGKLSNVYEIIADDKCLCKQDKKVLDELNIVTLLFQAQVTVRQLPCVNMERFFSSFSKKLASILRSIQEEYMSCIFETLKKQDE